MKLKGKSITNRNIEIVVLPRGDGDDLVFQAQAIIDYSPFEKICPEPKPPTKLRRDGAKIEDVKDSRFLAMVLEYSKKRASWIILESLSATEGLEWDTIDMSNPDTWNKYQDELKASGLVEAEIVRLINAVAIANALDDSKIEEARKRFLLGQEEKAAESSSLQDGQSSTPSGEPAKE